MEKSIQEASNFYKRIGMYDIFEPVGDFEVTFRDRLNNSGFSKAEKKLICSDFDLRHSLMENDYYNKIKQALK